MRTGLLFLGLFYLSIIYPNKEVDPLVGVAFVVCIVFALAQDIREIFR